MTAGLELANDAPTTASPRVVGDVVMTPSAAKLHDAQAIANPGQLAALDLTIFVSCYNEEAFIVGTLETIRDSLALVGRLSYEIIVIDDRSTDSSATLVESFISAHPEERILLRRNRVNRGLAQNYLDCAFIGKGKYYRLICGDNAEPQDTMIAVFSEVGQADMLIPYYVSAEGKSLFRRSLSNAYSLLLNFITRYRLHYYNGLAVHLRYNVMRWHPNTRGFGFQADIICMLLDEGFTYREVPVRTIERKKGDSKALTFKNMLSVTHTILDIVIRRISNRVYRPAPSGANR
ncbi:glycosyltransferase [Methylocapsa sp. S129]|uniref:glycosyltransferase family 2 protein n=1 Tax=Methylocapsa sp. S129 TaxID=1641869 RepID=UPI00131DDB93|nr:glycosyltransferase [Methylocapsa sp. S129]